MPFKQTFSPLHAVNACLAITPLLLAAGAQADASISPELRAQDLNGRSVEEAYGGVVVGQTVTVVGQDFYQYFVARWRDQPSSERYTISVHERPSARLGNLVWVEYERMRLFQTILPVSRSQIRPVGEQAAEITWQRLIEFEIERKLYNDADLAKDEF